MKSKEDLRSLLRSIDHRGYPAYKDTRGTWQFENYTLSIDHVQGDPYASPSNLSLVIPGRTANFPKEYYSEPHRRTALEDHLLRLFERSLSGRARDAGYQMPQDADAGRHGRGDGARRGSGKSGFLGTSRPGQEILERTACRVDPASGSVKVCLEAGFPAAGRTILAGELITMLFEILPSAVRGSLIYARIDQAALKETIELADDQAFIRSQLAPNGLCAFVADGACLPRRSGISELPMKDAVLFKSPERDAVTLTLPHRGNVRGMGIRKGITLIVGGGYHGKSTLLKALEKGIYNHIAGDGRELVITDISAMKIRAEDGRCVKHKDISLFISLLPNGKNTSDFVTEDASGSTSQAANVVEAMEAGAGALLIDEDTSATNFMVRDELMAEIISREKEPITPFISRIRDLYETSGISTVLVAGSSGAYFYVADTILQMDRYVPRDITENVREVLASREAARDGNEPASRCGNSGEDSAAEPAGGAKTVTGSAAWLPDSGKTVPSGVYRAENYREPDTSRPFRPDASLRREQRLKLKVLDTDSFLVAHKEVELAGLEQIADKEQTRMLAYILKYMELHILDGKKTIKEAVAQMQRLLEEKGLEVLFERSWSENGLAAVRPQEIFGTLNRYRG